MNKTLLLCGALLSTGAFAEDSATYFGVSRMKAETTFSDSYFDSDKDAEPTAWFATFGHAFNKHFALEARLGRGLSSDSVSSSGFMLPADIEIESFRGIYGKLSLPLGENVAPYAVFGYTKGELSIEFSDGFSVSSSESDRSLGFGINFFLGESATLNIENTTYIDKGGAEVSGLSFGYAYRF